MLQMFGEARTAVDDAVADKRILLMDFRDPHFSDVILEGCMSYWIMPDDLAANRFDTAWGTYDGT